MTDSDFTVQSEDGAFLLTPVTLRAESWSANHFGTLQRIGRAYLISSTTQFAHIVNSIVEAGLIVEERRRVN